MSLKKFIVDKKGQWKHPGENTMIPDANGRITMKGVNNVLLGIDDQGNKKIMLPGKEYQFPGNDVYEIPLTMKKKQMGGAQNDQQMLLDMVQQYAQAIGADPQQIMQELQSAGPEEQQQMVQQIMEAVQQGMPEENPYQAQLGGAPADHVFNPPPQEMYSPMDMTSMYSQGPDEQMQMGGSNTNQATGYMGKTNNFVNWLKKKSMTANMEQMNQMMMKFGGNLPQAQNGGNYMDKNGFYHNVNKEAAYMNGNTQKQPYTGYGNYNPVFNPLNGGYSSLFNTQMPVIPSKLPRDMAIQTNTSTKKNYTNPNTNTNTVVNQNQNTDQIFDQTTTDNTNTVNTNNPTNWQGGWYDPNDDQPDVTDPSMTNPTLSQGYNNSYSQANNGYTNQYGQGSGTPYFNFGYPSFGGGLFNFLPNMIMALGSLGQMGRMGNNNPLGRNSQRQSIQRDNRSLFNKKKTVGLDYSNDPNHQGDRGDGIKSLEQGKYPNNFMSYEDEIKLLAEQNAPTSADRTKKAFDFLKKKKAVKTGGIMKAQDGTEIDLEDPDYFNLEYNMYPYGQNEDIMSPDPNRNFAPPAATGPKATPAKSQGTGFNMGSNPFMAEGIISDINAITNMKNQTDMAKADRLQKRDLNDVTKNHSTAKKTNRGDWFSGPGLGFGMFRPNQNIYSGPNAFAKKGGTFFNSNFYQDGGENTQEDFDYIEGDEMFLSDAQIQKLLDSGADIEFL